MDRRTIHNSAMFVAWATNTESPTMEILGDLYLKLPLPNDAVLIMIQPGFEPQISDMTWAGIVDRLSGRVWCRCRDSEEGCEDMLALMRSVRDKAVQLTLASPASGLGPGTWAMNNAFDAFCSDDPAAYLRNCVAQELLPDDRLQIHRIDGAHMFRSVDAILRAFRDPDAFVQSEARRMTDIPHTAEIRERYDSAMDIVQTISTSEDHLWHGLRTLYRAAVKSGGLSVNVFVGEARKKKTVQTLRNELMHAAINVIHGANAYAAALFQSIEKMTYSGRVLYDKCR